MQYFCVFFVLFCLDFLLSPEPAAVRMPDNEKRPTNFMLSTRRHVKKRRHYLAGGVRVFFPLKINPRLSDKSTTGRMFFYSRTYLPWENPEIILPVRKDVGGGGGGGWSITFIVG